MKRKSLTEFNCSWAQAAEAMGDKWSMMIIRDALYGIKTFSAFEKDLGISKNILTARLEHLVEHGIMEKVPSAPGSPRFAYILTNKGKGLLPFIIALGQWGDKWVYGEGNEPVVLVDTQKKQPIESVVVLASDGRALGIEDIGVKAGNGASESTKVLIEQVNALRNH